jgi:pimeloyl-ACP methyl ester carboxylesterase
VLLGSLIFVLCQGPVLQAAEKADAETPAAFSVKVTGSGRPMILIPGLSCGGDVWDDAVAHFKGSYECHVVTLAGFAGQPSTADPSLRKVLDGLSEYIREKKLQRPVIVGHSLGGFLAFWLGIELPGEVGPIVAVDGVPYYPALMEAGATPEAQRPAAETLRNMIKGQTTGQFAFGNRWTLSTMITDAKEVERVAASSSRSDPKAVGQAMYEIMTIDLRDKVKAIRSPVLLLGATNALASADEQKREEESYRAQMATVPRHKVVFAPKSRHFIQLDAPAFFYQEVESFLQGAEVRQDLRSQDSPSGE